MSSRELPGSFLLLPVGNYLESSCCVQLGDFLESSYSFLNNLHGHNRYSHGGFLCTFIYLNKVGFFISWIVQ